MATVDLGVVETVGRGFTSGALSYHYNWSAKQVLPAGRMMGVLVSEGGFLYYIGGQSTTTDSSAVVTVYKYDPSLNTWTTVTSLGLAGQARTKAYPITYNGETHLLGGQNSSSLQTSVKYNLATGAILNRANIPFLGSVWYGSWVRNDRLYTYTDPWFYEYNPATNTWNYVIVNQSNATGSAAVLGPDDKGHIFGGASALTQHWVYDHNTGTFSAGTAIPSPGVQGSPGIVVKNGLIHLIGGRNSSADIATVRTFDTLTNTWSTKPDLPAARAYIGHGAVADASGIWVAGGASGSAGQTTLYLLRSPEVDMGAVAAVGRGYTTAAADLAGEAVGTGETEADLQVRWSGKQMYAGGMIPVSGQRLIDYWTERSPIR